MSLFEMDWLDKEWLLISNFKWLALIGALVVGIAINKLLRPLLTTIKSNEKLNLGMHPFLRIFMDQPIQKPISWIVTSLFWLAVLETLKLPPNVGNACLTATHLFMTFHIIRLAYMAAESLGRLIDELVKKTENTLDDQLAPFIRKTLKVLVVVFGILSIFQNLGFNVVSLVAGLGIGGLAIAFAAQDTVANVFGSITLILDRPFQVGDWVKVTDTEGHIEEIGFRSTRIRTFYGSLVSIPNAVMAKEKIDNMGLRPTRRIRHTLGLTYGTPVDQIKLFTDRIRYIIFQQPKAVQDGVVVAFNAMGDFNLQILVSFHVRTTESSEELHIQEEVLFAIMDTAKEMGIEFAFPTQTVEFRNIEPKAVTAPRM